jgi:hypothetical protein
MWRRAGDSKQRDRSNRRRAKRAGSELAQTLSVASQMALLCPSGMDIWMQRELTGYTDLDRFEPGGPR